MTEYTQLERQTDNEYICSSIIRTDNAHAHCSKLSSQCGCSLKRRPDKVKKKNKQVSQLIGTQDRRI